MDKTKVIVNINGNEYVIKGEESQEEMLKIASYVDKKIKDLTSLNNKLNPTYVSVLSALNITNEFFKMRKEYEEFKNSSLDPIKQLSELKLKNNTTLKENNKLQEQLDIYSNDFEKGNIQLKNVQEQNENLNNEYMNKSEELSKSYREYELMRREKENKQKELERVKLELSESKYKLIDLQNQLLQNQIDLVKTKKEFDDLRINYRQSSNASKI